MGRSENYIATMNFGYSPTFKIIQISTKRAPAMASGKISTPVTNLTGVESSPLILQDSRNNQGIRQSFGLEGSAVQLWELYFKKCAHVDSSVNVNQLPDIIIGDIVVVNSIDYRVRWADITHPFAFGDVLICYVVEDKQ
jgi:hypothetical protein